MLNNNSSTRINKVLRNDTSRSFVDGVDWKFDQIWWQITFNNKNKEMWVKQYDDYFLHKISSPNKKRSSVYLHLSWYFHSSQSQSKLKISVIVWISSRKLERCVVAEWNEVKWSEAQWMTLMLQVCEVHPGQFLHSSNVTAQERSKHWFGSSPVTLHSSHPSSHRKATGFYRIWYRLLTHFRNVVEM